MAILKNSEFTTVFIKDIACLVAYFIFVNYYFCILINFRKVIDTFFRYQKILDP